MFLAAIIITGIEMITLVTVPSKAIIIVSRTGIPISAQIDISGGQNLEIVSIAVAKVPILLHLISKVIALITPIIINKSQILILINLFLKLFPCHKIFLLSASI